MTTFAETGRLAGVERREDIECLQRGMDLTAVLVARRWILGQTSCDDLLQPGATRAGSGRGSSVRIDALNVNRVSPA